MDQSIGLPNNPATAPSSLPVTGRAGGPASSDPERAKLKKAATEFESFFLYYMLKSMRQSVPKSGLLDSRHSDTYLSMMDQEVANLAAKRGGFGLAQAIEKQLLPRVSISDSSISLEQPITGPEKEGLVYEHIR